MSGTMRGEARRSANSTPRSTLAPFDPMLAHRPTSPKMGEDEPPFPLAFRKYRGDAVEFETGHALLQLGINGGEGIALKEGCEIFACLPFHQGEAGRRRAGVGMALKARALHAIDEARADRVE